MAKRVSPTETEYAGTVPTTNTVQPKLPSSLSSTEKLRLGYLTGQETDTEAVRDPAHWHGAVDPNLRSKR